MSRIQGICTVDRMQTLLLIMSTIIIHNADAHGTKISSQHYITYGRSNTLSHDLSIIPCTLCQTTHTSTTYIVYMCMSQWSNMRLEG